MDWPVLRTWLWNMSSMAAIATTGCGSDDGGSPPPEEEEEYCPEGSYPYQGGCLGPGPLPEPDPPQPPRPCETGEQCQDDEVCGDDFVCVDLEFIEDCEPYQAGGITMPMATNILSLTFVDADGDPAMDLAIGHEEGLSLILGADPTAVTTVLDTTDGWIIDLAAADFTGDGIDDLIVVDPGLSLLAGDGSGSFAAPVPLVGSALAIEPLDWDGDGALDLAALEGPTTRVLVDGLVTSVALDVDDGWTMAVADIDADGLDDVALNVLRNRTTTVALLGNAERNGARKLELHSHFADGDLIAGGNFTGSPGIAMHHEVYEGRRRIEGVTAAGKFHSQLVASDASANAVEDMDGDGLDDLVLFDDNYIVVLQGNPAGDTMFRCAGLLPLAGPFVGYAVGDMDGDGRAEIVYGDEQLVIVRRV